VVDILSVITAERAGSKTNVCQINYTDRGITHQLDEGLLMFQVIVLFMLSVPLSGCLLLNDVNPISPVHLKTPPRDRAIVIFGLSVEGQIDPRAATYNPGFFEIGLDEYSIEREHITGGCWRYNNMRAKVPGIIGTRQYFAFDVKSGYYVSTRLIDPYNPKIARKSLVFEVPAGKIVYLGDFIWTTEASIELKRDPSAVRSWFGEGVLLADTRQGSQYPGGVLCMI
jgi:hypothetical protein